MQLGVHRVAVRERADDARHGVELDAHLVRVRARVRARARVRVRVRVRHGVDAHLALLVAQRLARLEHEWHAVPARVVHVQHGGGEGLRAAVLVLQRRVVEVAELAPRLAGVAFAAVLANGQVLTHQRADGLQHLG